MHRGFVFAVAAASVLASAAFGDVVVERWGASASCRHGGTAKFTAAAAGGTLVEFDLSALPAGAKVIRARFVPLIRAGGVPLEEPVVIHAVAAADGAAGPAAVGEALPLEPPRFVSFDATEAVRRWAADRTARTALWVRGAKIEPARTYLEIAYEGRLTDPPPPVSGLKAFHRAGQVFLTWNEINSPFAGQEQVAWKDLQAELGRRAEGDVTAYHIYRHTAPITPQTIAQAAWVDQVEQHSAFDLREIRTEWKGERIKNVRVPEAVVPRTAVEQETELPAGTGVWATTCRAGGRFYYAVVSAVGGVQNTVALNAGNTAGPVAEKVAPAEPILFREQVHMYQKDRPQHCYLWWIDPPLWNVPHYLHLSLSPPAPKDAPEGPRPMAIYSWWWSSGWSVAVQYPIREAVGLTVEQNCMQTRGFHDGLGTYKAWSQGQVRCWFVRQLRALLPWIRAKYHVDEDRIFAESSGWAWHYPEIFAATFECTTMNPKRSPSGNECRRYWGDPKSPAPTEWGQSAWDYWNAGEWIAAHPDVELACLTYAPCMHTGDFGILDKPPLYRALLDTRRAWATYFGEGGLIGHRAPECLFQLRRTDSVPAFGNCSLDDNPGIGFGWDPGGQMNAYLCFEPRSQVDQPGRWEMTLYLASGDSQGRGAAPLDACTADVTPRRTQRFKAAPGERFAWTNTSLADGKVVQSGTAAADGHGWVTVEKVIISKGKNRLALVAAR